jgi:hypothetical protein
MQEREIDIDVNASNIRPEITVGAPKVDPDTRELHVPVEARLPIKSDPEGARIASDMVADVLAYFGTLPKYVSIDFGFADVSISFNEGAFDNGKPADNND